MNEKQLDSQSPLTEMQGLVKLKLRHSILQLEQYESLLRRVLPYLTLFGEPTPLPALLTHSPYAVDSTTISPPSDVLLAKYLRTSNQHTVRHFHNYPEIGEIVWAASYPHLLFDVECYNSIKGSLSELIVLRNELEHRFLSKFDLGSFENCAIAEASLNASRQKINKHYESLNEWAELMADAKYLVTAVVQSPLFKDFLSDGIFPDGTVYWCASGIVQGLRDAEAELADGNWTSMEDALAWMRTNAPEQTPQRYGCTTWRQVLYECKQFDVFKDTVAIGNKDELKTLFWYRSRRYVVPG